MDQGNTAERKKVSVLIPCRNEKNHIETCLRNVYGFHPPEGGFEVMVIDGRSDDGTREILTRASERYPGLVILDNPEKSVPHAMNLGISAARGDYIVRTDVRCNHPASYLLDLLDLVGKTGADNVGGVLVPVGGDTYIGNSIALAYQSRIAMGTGLRDRGDFLGQADTVYGGCFRRELLIRIGKYDETMIRNQDDELCFRLRKMGGKIIQSGKIKILYSPRKHYRQLFKQFMQYGYWKIEVIRKNVGQSSLRHFLPGVVVLTIALLAPASFFFPGAQLAMIVFGLGYLLPLVLESGRVAWKKDRKLWPGAILAILIIHLSFGIGFLAGLTLKALRVRHGWFQTLSR